MFARTRARDRKRLADAAHNDLVKLSAPAFGELVKLTETTGEVAKQADERLESFSEKYPFYSFRRSESSPAISLLGHELRFLSLVAMDGALQKAGIGLGDTWSDGGPPRYKRLLTGGGVRGYFGGDYDEADWKDADLAYRALLPVLLSDCKTILKPLEKFSRTVNDLESRTHAFLASYTGDLPIGGGYGVSLIGVSQLLLRSIYSWPGAVDLIQGDKSLDIGFWARGGQPPGEKMPEALKREFEPLIVRLRRLEGLLLKE